MTWRQHKTALYVAPEQTGYNGWANYETWAVGLWVDNEQALYYEKIELTCRFTDDDSSYRCAQAIKEWIESMQPDLGASLWSDLLGGAMSEVDWGELADHWLAEAREAAAE